MTLIKARLYCVDSDDVGTVVIGSEEPVTLEFTRKDGSEPVIKSFRIDVEVDLENEIPGEWIRENVKVIDGVPVLPDCIVTVIEEENA